MKLLLITNNFPPISCGVGDYTYHIAQELVSQGHVVSVICRSNQGISEYWSNVNEGFSVNAIGGNWAIEDWKIVLSYIDNKPIDDVIFQYVPSAYNKYATPWPLLFFFKQVKRLPVNLVTTFHETYVRYNWSHPKYVYVALSQRFIARYVAKNSNQLITSIDRYENQLQKWNSNISLIPIGSNILPITVTKEEILKLRSNIAPNGETIFCTFGNRNHQLFFELFIRILEIKPNSVLLIIGKVNADLNVLANSIRNKVYVTGFLEASEVFKYLKSSDAFIMLDNVGEKGNGGTCNKSGSLAAGFAAGLPIFATKGDMTNTLLVEKSGIKFVPFNNVNKASEIIVRCLENHENLSKQVTQSEIFYSTFLSYKTIISKYLKFLKYK